MSAASTLAPALGPDTHGLKSPAVSQLAAQAMARSLNEAGGGFTSWCLALLGQTGRPADATFPLRGELAPVSTTCLAFQARSVSLQTKFAGPSPAGLLPTTRLALNLYSLAGADGPLPLFLTEHIQTEKGAGGLELHAFLDMLNLRTWELMFLRDVSGHDPRYIGFNPSHARWLDKLTQAIAQVGVPDRDAVHPNLQRLVLQQGFTAGRRGGDASNLAAVLSALLACAVEVRRHAPIRLNSTARSILGRAGKTLLGQGAGLGARTWVASATDIVLQLNTAADTVEAIESLLDKAHRCAEMLFGATTSLVRFHIRVPPMASPTRLGAPCHRLGRLAALGGSSDVCRILRSTPGKAMTHENKETP